MKSVAPVVFRSCPPEGLLDGSWSELSSSRPEIKDEPGCYVGADVRFHSNNLPNLKLIH